MTESRFSKRFAWFVFGVMPTVVLALSIVLAALATIVLDHDILGRDADGWPVLYKTPLLRHAVDVFHLGVTYVLPLAVALPFLAIGQRVGAKTVWVVVGGMLACAVGSVYFIEAGWTGVKGASDLHIGLVDNGVVLAARLAGNMAIYAIASLLINTGTEK